MLSLLFSSLRAILFTAFPYLVKLAIFVVILRIGKFLFRQWRTLGGTRI